MKRRKANIPGLSIEILLVLFLISTCILAYSIYNAVKAITMHVPSTQLKEDSWENLSVSKRSFSWGCLPSVAAPLSGNTLEPIGAKLLS